LVQISSNRLLVKPVPVQSFILNLQRHVNSKLQEKATAVKEIVGSAVEAGTQAKTVELKACNRLALVALLGQPLLETFSAMWEQNRIRQWIAPLV